jgi:predicted RNase H-like nuclease (RuvC/YqgF family)
MSCIIGIDIVKGSPLAREAPEYAVAVLRDGVLEKHEGIGVFKLLRLIEREKPEIVAVDNIHELAGDKRELILLLKKFPPHTKLVQVTGSERPEPLVRVAQRFGIAFDRLNPIEEAIAIAKLAALGIGYEVLVFEDRTIVKVSRARSLGKGGWSQNRYRRKVHGEVLQRVRGIEREIKDRGLKFELKVKRAYGGIASGEFIVEAKKAEVGVREERCENVQVKVEAIERDGIKFNPLRNHNHRGRYIIVGVDPGTTTAIAVLDLNGNLKSIVSSRVFSFADIVEHISSSGDPLVIATDVTPTPMAVERIKRVFNAVLYTPARFISTEEKIYLAKRFGYANDHERDAIAAALLAFNSYKSKFTQIEKKAPASLNVEELKAMVVRGSSVDSAILQLDSSREVEALEAKHVEVEREGEGEGEREKEREKVDVELKLELKRYMEQVERLKSFVEELKAEVKSKDIEILSLKEQIEALKTAEAREIKKARAVEFRDREIARLKLEIAKLKEINSQLELRMNKLKEMKALEARGKAMPVKVISTFTRDAILQSEREFGIKKGDVIYLEDASGGGSGTAELLIEKQIEAIIASGEMSHIAREKFQEANIPVLSLDEVEVERAEGFAVVELEKLRAAILNYKARVEKLKEEKKLEMIESLVREYKAERRK